MTKIKAKQIAVIVLAILLLLMMISLVACSFIKQNYNISVPKPSSIKIVSYNNVDEEMVTDSANYDKIMQLYNDSFKQSYLVSLFEGLAFKKVEWEKDYRSVNNLKKKDQFLLHFQYDEPQKLNFNTEYSTNEYTDVYIQVLNSSKLTQINAYIRLKNQTSSYCQYKFISYACQSNLFDYLNSL